MIRPKDAAHAVYLQEPADQAACLWPAHSRSKRSLATRRVMQSLHGDAAELLLAVRAIRPVALRCDACQGLFVTAADVSSPSLRRALSRSPFGASGGTLVFLTSSNSCSGGLVTLMPWATSLCTHLSTVCDTAIVYQGFLETLVECLYKGRMRATDP